MRKMDEYLATIDTMYPDGYARETVFRDSGDMVDGGSSEPAAIGIMTRFVRAIRNWHVARIGRLALRDLDDAQLRDIGITRREADEEARKSYFLFR